MRSEASRISLSVDTWFYSGCSLSVKNEQPDDLCLSYCLPEVLINIWATGCVGSSTEHPEE